MYRQGTPYQDYYIIIKFYDWTSSLGPNFLFIFTITEWSPALNTSLWSRALTSYLIMASIIFLLVGPWFFSKWLADIVTQSQQTTYNHSYAHELSKITTCQKYLLSCSATRLNTTAVNLSPDGNKLKAFSDNVFWDSPTILLWFQP